MVMFSDWDLFYAVSPRFSVHPPVASFLLFLFPAFLSRQNLLRSLNPAPVLSAKLPPPPVYVCVGGCVCGTDHPHVSCSHSIVKGTWQTCNEVPSLTRLLLYGCRVLQGPWPPADSPSKCLHHCIDLLLFPPKSTLSIINFTTLRHFLVFRNVSDLGI